RLGTETAVAEQAVAGTATGHLEYRIEAELLEGADPLTRSTGCVGKVLQLLAMIEGKDAHHRPAALAGRRPVPLFEFAVEAERRILDAAIEEELQLVPAGVGGSTAVAGDGKGAAG